MRDNARGGDDTLISGTGTDHDRIDVSAYGFDDLGDMTSVAAEPVHPCPCMAMPWRSTTTPAVTTTS